jgi:GNAT superfamily N-acetyltransferase
MLKFQQVDKNFCFKDFFFDSGNKDLNDFLYNNALDFIKEGYAQIYILKDTLESKIIGFFTISCCQIEFNIELISVEKKARYIPGLLVGQLAVNKMFQNKKFGMDLLKKAILIGDTISKNVGCRLIIVDAFANLDVIRFYQKFNFKFVKTGIGEKVIRQLKENKIPQYNTVKMYFDLKDINN